MRLRQAFHLARGDVVSFIGAGGKTSLLVGLGYELAEAGWRTLATATTALSVDQLDLFPHAMSIHAPAAAVSDALSQHHFVLLYGERGRGRVDVPALALLPRLLDAVDSDVLLVEADTAAGLPLKAPREDEPRIPLGTSLVVPVASLGVLGQPLDEHHVYNPQPMMDKYGFAAGHSVKSPWLAQVLRDEELGLKDVPAGARVIAFLNQAPARGWLRGRARMIARLALQSKRIDAVALGSVRSAEPVHEVQRRVGAMVLAGGRSALLGRDKTTIARISEQFIRSRLKPICAVAGCGVDEIEAALGPLGVEVARGCPRQDDEVLSSLQAGLRALPDDTAAVLIALGGQPRLQPKVIYKMLSAYAGGQGDWLMPSYQRRRGWPILMGRRYWPEILKLPRRAAWRDVMRAHEARISDVPVDTDSVLDNAGTSAGLHHQRRRAGLKN